MTGPEPIRMAVVGCGDIAASGHLPAIARSREVELTAVLDSDTARAGRAAARYGAAVADSIVELAGLDVTAVVVATPPSVTPVLTVEALEAGLDVLCEKPMAVDLAAAERVGAVGERCGRIVQVGFKNRFSPLVRAVGDWVRSGELGGPLAFTLGGFDEALDPADPEHERRIRAFLHEAPSFVHEGAHFADHLAFLTGSEPVSVHAVGVRTGADFGNDNFVSALVRYRNGDVARLEIGWFFPVSPVGEFRVLGPLGVAIVDRPGGRATLTTRAGTREVRLDAPWNDVCFDLQLQHFVRCVRARVEPETSAAAGIASLRLGRQVVQALQNVGEAG